MSKLKLKERIKRIVFRQFAPSERESGRIFQSYKGCQTECLFKTKASKSDSYFLSFFNMFFSLHCHADKQKKNYLKRLEVVL